MDEGFESRGGARTDNTYHRFLPIKTPPAHHSLLETIHEQADLFGVSATLAEIKFSLGFCTVRHCNIVFLPSSWSIEK